MVHDAAHAMVEVTKVYDRMMRGLCWLQGARSHRIRYSEGTVHVVDVRGRGSLPPLVLVHGFSASGPTQYMPMVRRLRHRVRRIVMPDLPGHGGSTIPTRIDGAVVQRGLDNALDAVLDEPAVVFATSLAGGFAVRYARASPHKVRGLMLCSPSGAPLTNDELTQLHATFRVDTHRQALMFVDRLFPRPHPLRHGYAWGVRRQFNRPHLVSLLQTAGDADFLRPEELRGLSMPVSLLWGEADRILPRAHLEFFKSHLPEHAEIDTPATFGHAPFLNRAGEVTSRLLRFATRVANTPRLEYK